MKTKLIDITGKAISGEWGTDDTDGTGIPVLRTTNFTNDGTVNYSEVVTRQIKKKNIQDKFLRYGDIIIEKSGGSDKQPVGRVIFFEGGSNKFLFNNFTGLLRVKDTERWLPKYVFYALFANYLVGGTRPYENRTTGLHNLQTEAYVAKTEIPDIPYCEQQRIVAILDKICTLIDKSNQQLSTLDELVKARFVEIFGDLADPLCKWERVKLADSCASPDDIKCGPFGTQLSKDEYCTSGIALWEIPQINAQFSVMPTHFLNVNKAKELNAYSIIPGDIAMSRKGNVGRCAVFPSDFEPGIIHSDVLRIRVNQKLAIPVFMMYQLHYSGAVTRQIEQVSSGAIMAGINVTKLKSIFVHLPPMELQTQFAAFVQATDQTKSTIQASLDELETLKKSLMQDYFG